MKRAVRKTFVLLPLLVAGLLVGACKDKPQQPAAAGGPVEVNIVTLKPQPVYLGVDLPSERLYLTGTKGIDISPDNIKVIVYQKKKVGMRFTQPYAICGKEHG